MPSWRHTVHNSGSGVVNICDSNQYNYYGGNTRGYANSTSYTFTGHGDGGNVYTYMSRGRNTAGPRITTIDSSDDSFFPSLANAGNPTNHLYINSSNHPISGAYRVNPMLVVPRSLLSDFAASVPASQRSSFQAESQNGSIRLNIALSSPVDDKPSGDGLSRKAQLSFHTQNGSVNIRIAPTTSRSPFRLLAASTNGSVSVYIPRSFHGPVTLQSMNGTIRVSRDVQRDLIVLSEDGDKQKCFIGDLGDYTGHASSVGLDLDDLMLKTNNGSISVFYANERAGDEPLERTRAPDAPSAKTEDDEEDDEAWYSAEEELPPVNTSEMFGNGVHTVHTHVGGGVFNHIHGASHSFFWSSPTRHSRY